MIGEQRTRLEFVACHGRSREGRASLSDSISDLPETAAHMAAGSVLERLGPDASLGLTLVETASRLARFGPNHLRLKVDWRDM